MKDATTGGILERLIIGAGTKNEPGLAIALGISAQSIYNAKKKDKIPPAWGIEIAKTFGVSSDWIFFGLGPMRPGEARPTSTPHSEQVQPSETASTIPCARCEKLEAKLEKVENQRDELADENRRLLKENGLLREENATLRERQRREEASPFDERQHIPSSDDVLQRCPPVCK